VPGRISRDVLTISGDFEEHFAGKEGGCAGPCEAFCAVIERWVFAAKDFAGEVDELISEFFGDGGYGTEFVEEVGHGGTQGMECIQLVSRSRRRALWFIFRADLAMIFENGVCQLQLAVAAWLRVGAWRVVGAMNESVDEPQFDFTYEHFRGMDTRTAELIAVILEDIFANQPQPPEQFRGIPL
jgi:hypothetical protein